MVLNKRWFLLSLVLLLLLAAALAAINLPYGYAQDADGYLVLRKGLAWADQGYVRSRTWGFPAYEAVVYPLIAQFGPLAAKLYSLPFYLANAALVFFLASKVSAGRLAVALPAALGFVVLPVTIISGNTVLETSQGLFFALCGLWLFLRYFEDRRKRSLYLFALVMGIATATRADYVILSAAGALVLMLRGGLLRSGLKAWELPLLALLYLSAAVLPHLLLYGSLYFGLEVIQSDPFSRRVIRALIGAAALWGLPAVLVTLGGLWLNRKTVVDRIKTLPTDPLIMLFAAALPLYAVRYVLLPDELEYIYPLMTLFLLVLIKLVPRPAFFVVLAVALGLPNLIQAHFFTRDPLTYDNRASLGISPGALYQERQMRLLNEYKENELPVLLQQVAAQYGQTEFSFGHVDTPNTLVIMPEEELRYYRPDRMEGMFSSVFPSQTIVVYPLPLNYGWKSLMQYQEWRPLTLDDFHRVERLPGS